MTTVVATLAWTALLVGLAVVLYPLIRRERQVMSARDWPSIRGTVVDTANSTWDAHGQAIWWVRYQYVVNGTQYIGLLKSEMQEAIISDLKQSVGNVFPIGSEIEVRYCPTNPEESVAVGRPLLSPSFNSER